MSTATGKKRSHKLISNKNFCLWNQILKRNLNLMMDDDNRMQYIFWMNNILYICILNFEFGILICIYAVYIFHEEYY